MGLFLYLRMGYYLWFEAKPVRFTEKVVVYIRIRLELNFCSLMANDGNLNAKSAIQGNIEDKSFATRSLWSTKLRTAKRQPDIEMCWQQLPMITNYKKKIRMQKKRCRAQARLNTPLFHLLQYYICGRGFAARVASSPRLALTNWPPLR